MRQAGPSLSNPRPGLGHLRVRPTAARRGVFLGWKDFLVKDHPMLTPAQTMTKAPTPGMISYQ